MLEFEHLKGFASLLLSAEAHLAVRLETPEPGLMYVVVQLPDGRVAEVYSVPNTGVADKRQLAIFLAIGTSEDEEIYADTIEDAVSCFKRRLAR
jgi:hypothetical protein